MHSVVRCIILGMAAHSVAAGGSGYGPSGYGHSGYGPSGYAVSTDYVSRYHGPGAVPVVLPDGTLANTPEVAAARIAHLTALHKAQVLWFGGSGSRDAYYASPGNYGGSNSKTYSGSYSGVGGPWASYSGPLASTIVLPSGYLADSADVAETKAAHLGAVSKAYVEAARWPAEKTHNKGWSK